MSLYDYQKAKFGAEMTRDAATFTGSFQTLGTFTDTPVKVIIQNDTTVTVTLSDDGGTTSGLSLVTGIRLVLDMQSSKVPSDWWSFRKGQTMSVSGTAGTGLFKISYLYAT